MSSVLLRSRRVRGWVTVTLVAIMAVSLLCGLVIFIWSTVNHTGAGLRDQQPTPPVTFTASATGHEAPAQQMESLQSEEDRLAARPMLAVPLSAANPRPLAPNPAPATTLSIPVASDPAAVPPTGFPGTPEGAVAQLAAIDAAVFATMQPTTTSTVHSIAALPGAVPVAQWSPSVAVTAILAGLSAPAGSPDLASSWTLTHAQVKGVLDDGRFVVACVLGELDGTYRASTSRIGLADCQRMVWQGGRWWIGPGAQPAWPPSTWPGSADCFRAGWVEARRA